MAKGTLPNLPFVRELSEITINYARINHGRSVLICGRREINFEAKAQDPRTPGLGSCEYCIPLSPSVQSTERDRGMAARSRVCTTYTHTRQVSTCPVAPARLEHARAYVTYIRMYVRTYVRTRRRIARVLSTMFLGHVATVVPRSSIYARARTGRDIIGALIPRRIYALHWQ